MIHLSQLSKTYSGTTVLSIDALELQPGEIIGLIGNNGAGKTTFFSLLLDLIKPSTGYIENQGVRVNESEAWKSTTSAFIDENFLIGYLTAEEYFEFIAGLRGINKADLNSFMEGFKTFFNDEILGNKKYIRDYSKGNQKKIGIAAAFIGTPALVILDEPFANLDPRAQMQLQKLIKTFNSEHGVSLLVSSHDLLHVSEVSHRTGYWVPALFDVRTSEITLDDLRAFFSEEVIEESPSVES